MAFRAASGERCLELLAAPERARGPADCVAISHATVTALRALGITAEVVRVGLLLSTRDTRRSGLILGDQAGEWELRYWAASPPAEIEPRYAAADFSVARTLHEWLRMGLDLGDVGRVYRRMREVDPAGLERARAKLLVWRAAAAMRPRQRAPAGLPDRCGARPAAGGGVERGVEVSALRRRAYRVRPCLLLPVALVPFLARRLQAGSAELGRQEPRVVP